MAARWRERGRDQEPERAGTEDGHDVALGDRRAEHGVHRAGHRLDGHRVGVAEPVGHRVELARGARPGRRSTNRRRCRRRTRSAGRAGCGRRRRCPQLPTWPAWQAGHGGSIPRAAHPSTGCSTTRLPAASAPRRRRPRPRADRADHLVARDEGKRDDVLEVARAAPVEGRQVRAADARQHGVDVHPALGRRSGRVLLDQAQRPDAGAAPRAEGRHDAGGREARQRALEEQRAHRPITASWEPSRRTGPAAGAGASRPRPWPSARRASPAGGRWRPAATRGSTATGNPTASSMARSLAESA